MQDRRESWIFILTLGSAASVLLSIAGAETLLAIACLAWLIVRPRPIEWPGYAIPLFAFMLATVLSLVMSPHPEVGMGAVRKFVLFSMGLLVTNFVNGPSRARISHVALLAVAAVTSVTGFMGHWMTFSGEQLLVWCAAVPAMVILGRRWSIPLAVIGAALVLSFTRSAWLGGFAGLLAVAFMIPRKVLIGVIVPLAIVSVVASGLIYHRIAMSFGEKFAPDTGRLEMLFAGFRMIQDHPLFGVGPERIHTEFPHYYRGTNLQDFYYGHLHNNVVQIAAERGLPCLATFIWFILAVYADLMSMLKTAPKDTRWTILSAIAALSGFVVAGFFEYNFGDSEVLLLLLFIVSVPYGLHSVPSEVGERSRAQATYAS